MMASIEQYLIADRNSEIACPAELLERQSARSILL
jgi:hypothetical protein